MRVQHLARFAALALAALTAVHKIDDHETFLSEREYFTRAARSLDSCAGHPESKGDTDQILNTTHLYNGTLISPDTPDAVFAGTHHVLLNTYGDTGPDYVRGELIREDVREDESGIPIVAEGKFIDYVTCEPVAGMWWDLWNANATGVHSGVINEGNGNFLGHNNVNHTVLQSLQQADEDGVARLTTIFPGYYCGRTNHIHIIALANATVNPNNSQWWSYQAYRPVLSRARPPR